jgi:hypothetical protein
VSGYVFVQGFAADIGQPFTLGLRQFLQRFPGALGNSYRQAWGAASATGDRRPAPMPGDGALSELFGKAAAVSHVNLLGLEVDVGADRARLDPALGYWPAFR